MHRFSTEALGFAIVINLTIIVIVDTGSASFGLLFLDRGIASILQILLESLKLRDWS